MPAIMTTEYVAILAVVVGGVMSQFNPLLNVESCTKSKLTVSTYGASDNGLIYIQGKGDNCKQVTADGLALYEFNFLDCGIEWEMLFKIVIQKNQGFQTGADKQIPIFCVADRGDLIVTNSKNTEDKGDDTSLNMTVKPSASMTFYKVVSEEEVSGTEVRLTDTLIMSLQLGQQWTEDFDIKARYCVASDIVIIDNFCATDSDLFPDFSRIKTGYLISEFGAFRATNLESGSIQMNFSCILQVCKDACDETDCGETTGWGRRRRDITNMKHNVIGEITADGSWQQTDNVEREKRETENFEMDVGAKVKIVEKYSDIQIVTKETLCLNVAIFIITIIILGTGFVGFAGVSMTLYRKWTSANKAAKKLDGGRDSAIRKHTIPHQPVQTFDNPYISPY